MVDIQQRCPLCEQANLCALGNDPLAKSCWCQHASFPKALLTKANAATPNDKQRCVCHACAEKAQRLAKHLTTDIL